MSTYSVGHSESEGGFGWKVFAVFAGFLIPFVMIVGLWLAVSAHRASNDAREAAASAKTAATETSSMPGMSTSASAAGSVATPSFAGVAPANADALAMAHAAVPAALPAAPAGGVARVTLDIRHSTISVAPGIHYDAWTFGRTAPGPVIHVRVGQTVRVTLHEQRTDGALGRLPRCARSLRTWRSATCSRAEQDLLASWRRRPVSSCTTAGPQPAFVHIANGMYGAIIVEPRDNLPKADREYVLVSSEWYLNKPGLGSPAGLDLTKAEQMTPDWVTWNGYAGQYKTHPLTADPGQTVRFWVVDAGPSLNTEFHVVGTVLSRAWLNADLVDAPQHLIQTAVVPAGGGGAFDVKIDKPGIYPFVSHSFASVQLGEVGLLNVGHVPGTMSH